LLCDRAQRFGLDLAQPSTLMLVEWDDLEAGQAARRLRASQREASAIFDDIDGVLTILCATAKADDLRRTIADLAGRAVSRRATAASCRARLRRSRSVPRRTRLRRALPVLARMGVQGHLVAQAEMALYATLFETHDQASLAAFLESTIGALLSHDRKRGSELADTLLCHFDCNQNAKAAAQRLGIHVNTVRQRLATIADLLGDWSDAVRALEIHVALRLWSLADR
jgi:DNA-binding PucR family transcriptional regulator